jgi:hypothetical protein
MDPGPSSDRAPSAPPCVVVRLPRLKPSAVYRSYWYLAAERQRIFFHRVLGRPGPATRDPVLVTYKFTNAYRASDRVSQFLIRHVIYGGDQSLEEVFFRTIMFKLFNRIETWELLEREIGEPRWSTYRFSDYDRVLSAALVRREKIYSAAYIIPPARSFGYPRKHQNHLRLLEQMMTEHLPERVAATRSLREVYGLLRTYPSIGDFLGFQFAIDLNYGPALQHDESEFVVPGPGAREGIRKCFTDTGTWNDEDIIRAMADVQEQETESLGLSFENLWGRRLQLIDCQNLFCEVDKYARVAHPEVRGTSGRVRIKQHYRPTRGQIHYWYPPKWGLNEKIASMLGVA